MKRVTGVGGIFFRAKDPKALYEWYRKHLGIESSPEAGAMFSDADHLANPGFTIWAIFPKSTEYFKSPDRRFMINFRVDDLEELLVQLAAANVRIDPNRENHDYGRFAWIWDPEGNRIELWEPPREASPAAGQ